MGTGLSAGGLLTPEVGVEAFSTAVDGDILVEIVLIEAASELDADLDVVDLAVAGTLSRDAAVGPVAAVSMLILELIDSAMASDGAQYDRRYVESVEVSPGVRAGGVNEDMAFSSGLSLSGL